MSDKQRVQVASIEVSIPDEVPVKQNNTEIKPPSPKLDDQILEELPQEDEPTTEN